MQDGDRLSSQTIGNVLDRPGSQRHPGAALLPSQWTLRGLLGGAPRGPGGLTSTSMSPAPDQAGMKRNIGKLSTGTWIVRGTAKIDAVSGHKGPVYLQDERFQFPVFPSSFLPSPLFNLGDDVHREHFALQSGRGESLRILSTTIRSISTIVFVPIDRSPLITGTFIPAFKSSFSLSSPTNSASTSFVFRCTGPATLSASMSVHSSFQNCYASSRSISLAVLIAP